MAINKIMFYVISLGNAIPSIVCILDTSPSVINNKEVELTRVFNRLCLEVYFVFN